MGVAKPSKVSYARGLNTRFEYNIKLCPNETPLNLRNVVDIRVFELHCARCLSQSYFNLDVFKSNHVSTNLD